MSRTGPSTASIEYTSELDEFDRDKECIYAECLASPTSYRVGPIWGQGPRSVRAALAQLTEGCDCDATWHEADGGEDEDEDEDLYDSASSSDFD